MSLPRFLVAGACVGILSLAGCSSSSGDASSFDNPNASLVVGASFYPLQFVAERVGGEDVAVSSLIAAGVEPHDAEMSPATVRSMQGMDTVVFLSDFSAAVDDAIETTGVRSLDAHHIVDEHVGDVVAHAEADHDHETGEAHEDDDHDHAEDEAHEDEEEGDDHDHDHGAVDPHFWQDPTLVAEFADDVAAEFSELDPDNAASYEERAEALKADLTDLDAAYTDGLAMCERRDIFVSHEAYGYLSARYDLHQEGLSGLDPEAEPSPARVRAIRDLVEDTGATTIFTESLVSANVADSLAEDVGVSTEVLDPIESIAEGDDYLSVMERNLEALRTGLDCS
ncbi:metal ABC transporter substrate-binding protein [uncultured Demequina sp.]|uniref:metal ABC transporter substrate-binding protein n=1 Tax=uncultured Demequina sp. TaxID=693499 RepID=UPI0025D2D557|nr:metal ABC transporter substrate-binding protein [uncultured Demequina sp.]